MHPFFQEIELIIKSGLTDAEVQISDMTGNLDHLEITVKSRAFQNLSLLAQHRKVMDLLAGKLKSDLHAVKIKTIVAQ